MKKGDLKQGCMLFAFFFKIGCFTFGGGWSILAQMEREFVDKKKAITKEGLLEMVAVGKSLPGIMITNISMLFGYHLGGVFGGACAVLGITFPAILILSVITYFYNALKSNYWCHGALAGIQAAVVPIIASAVVSLGKDALAGMKGKAWLCLGWLPGLPCCWPKRRKGGHNGLPGIVPLLFENWFYQFWRDVHDPLDPGGNAGAWVDGR